MGTSSGRGGARPGPGLAAVALWLVPVLVAGGAALAFAARRERAVVVATADTAAALAAASVDARLDVLKARLEALASDPDALGPDGAARLVRAITEEPAFGALHRVGPDGTPLAAAPLIATLDRRALHLSAPLAGATDESLVATVLADAVLAPLEARLTGAQAGRTRALPAGTRIRLVAAGEPAAASDARPAAVAEQPLATEGWRVRVEVPWAAASAAARFRLGASLLGLAAAAAAGVAFAAALLGRRRHGGARTAAGAAGREPAWVALPDADVPRADLAGAPAGAPAEAPPADPAGAPADAPAEAPPADLAGAPANAPAEAPPAQAAALPPDGAADGMPREADSMPVEPLSHGGDDDAVPIRALLHDLATSLTLAGNDARRLADGELGPLDLRQTEAVRQLAARLDGMMRLVRGVLADTAAGTEPAAGGPEGLGTPPVKRGPASLVTLAAEAAAAAARVAESRGITLILQPSAPEDGLLVGYWDSDSLGRVVANLLDNAVKYTPAEGTIRVSVKRDGRAALLTVQDTGAGLASDEVEAVFDAGRRGSAAGRLGAPGLGIGLATCRAIVAAHGGRVWLESAGPDKGTVATIRLPLDRRRAPRGHGRWPARVDWGGGQELSATVETISRSGAAIRVSVAPPIGALVALRIAGLPGDVEGRAGEPGASAAKGEDEVAAIGRVVRILEQGHPSDTEGRPAGAPDARAPLAAIAFAEVGPGTGARLERAVAAAIPDRR